MYEAILTFLMIFNIGGGGGNHLLDYVPSDYYWKSKNVTLTADAMMEELREPGARDISDLIAKLGSVDSDERRSAARQIATIGRPALPQLKAALSSVDPAVAVEAQVLIDQITVGSKISGARRLMAIRSLGEMKKNDALPLLQSLHGSSEPFVAEYAQRAIDQINGRATTRPAASDHDRMADLALMPQGSGLVLQATAGPSATDFPRLARLFDAMKLPPMPGPGPNMIAPDANQSAELLSKLVLDLVEKIGDARFDSVTFAVSEQVGPDSGWIVYVIRGQFDSVALGAALPADMTSKEVDGVKVFKPQDNEACIIGAENRIVMMVGPNEEALPIRNIVGALRDGKDGLAPDATLAKLLKSVDTKLPLWAVANINDNFRHWPPLVGLDSIIVTGTRGANQIDLKSIATGADARKIRDAANDLTTLISTLAQDVNGMRDSTGPAASAMAEFLKSVTFKPEGTNLTGAATFTSDASALMLYEATQTAALRMTIQDVDDAGRANAPPPVVAPAPASAAPGL